MPHTFWLPAEGMHKEQGEKGCLRTNPLATPLIPCQIYLCAP